MHLDSIYKTETELNLLEMLEKELSPLGFRVVDLDCRLSGKSLLRIFVERIGGPEGSVSIDDCAVISRHLDPILEQSSIFEGSYELEVSSPGLDRRLRLASDFEKATGREIKVAFTEGIPGVGAQARGELLGVQSGEVKLKVSGKPISVSLKNIKKAQTVWQYRI